MNKQDKKSGKHMKFRIGDKSNAGKVWLLYKNEELIGEYKTLKTVGTQIPVSPIYLWQLYNGYIVYKGLMKTKTSDGYHIKLKKDK